MTLLFVLILAVVLLFVIGGWVLGLALQLLWWALIGLLIGGLARLAVSGTEGLGLLTTALVGVGGALLGGIIADAVGVGSVLQFLIAVLVAAVLIAVLDLRPGRAAT
ncbi:MAG TPA: hypothetical protein VK915_03965 [Gaiellaceae bacterium]|nr:hypothetical protein [Gaiellaceae bacterium]